VEKILLHTQELQPDELSSLIVNSLDKSLDDIDELSLYRLKNARSNALLVANKSSRKLVNLSIAASVAALLLVPVLLHQPMKFYASDQDSDLITQTLSQDGPLSPEEMDDVEMMMALEDTDA